MINHSTAFVDSNIVIDIISEDPTWHQWSVDALESCERPFIGPFVFAELCYLKSSSSEVEQLLGEFKIGYQEIPKAALFLAAQAFKIYRKRGGNKTSPLPDFFIGAHAASEGVPIITRDVARYQTYFPSVELICP